MLAFVCHAYLAFVLPPRFPPKLSSLFVAFRFCFCPFVRALTLSPSCCLPERAFSLSFRALFCFRIRRASFSRDVAFFAELCFVRTTHEYTPGMYEHGVAEHQIPATTTVPHSTAQRSQPAQHAANQVRADQSATTQASRRSGLAPAYCRAYIQLAVFSK